MFQFGRIIYKVSFSEKEKFNRDTVHIFIFLFHYTTHFKFTF